MLFQWASRRERNLGAPPFILTHNQKKYLQERVLENSRGKATRSPIQTLWHSVLLSHSPQLDNMWQPANSCVSFLFDLVPPDRTAARRHPASCPFTSPQDILCCNALRSYPRFLWVSGIPAMCGYFLRKGHLRRSHACSWHPRSRHQVT